MGSAVLPSCPLLSAPSTGLKPLWPAGRLTLSSLPSMDFLSALLCSFSVLSPLWVSQLAEWGQSCVLGYQGFHLSSKCYCEQGHSTRSSHRSPEQSTLCQWTHIHMFASRNPIWDLLHQLRGSQGIWSNFEKTFGKKTRSGRNHLIAQCSYWARRMILGLEFKVPEMQNEGFSKKKKKSRSFLFVCLFCIVQCCYLPSLATKTVLKIQMRSLF